MRYCLFKKICVTTTQYVIFDFVCSFIKAAGLISSSIFTEELKIKRNLGGFHDSRVHACLYFITPNGHGLKSIDLVCMKKLDAKVNIIPIIAKADTINKTELNNFKVLKRNLLSFC